MPGERLPRYKVVTRAGILLGLAMVVGGFVVRDVSARMLMRADWAALALWAGGLALVAVGVVVNFRMIAGFFTGRGALERLNFGAAVVLALALAAMLCYISTRRYARIDWTALDEQTGLRRHELHSKSVNVLRSLDRKVEATVLFARTDSPLENRALNRTIEMLEEFAAQSGRFSLEQIDWSLPEGRARYEELRQRLDEDPPGFCVVFTAAEAHEVVPLTKLISPSPGGMMFTGEEAFAGALVKLIEPEQATVYFLTGHGERPVEAGSAAPGGEATRILDTPAYSLSRVAAALRRDHYEVKTLNLALQGAVPEDCAALIVAGPRAPLAEAEMKALRAYLDRRDAAALIMLDPRAVSGRPTNLPELLAEYGVRVRTDALGITALSTTLGLLHSADIPVGAEGMADHDITADLKSYTISLQQACPMEVEQAAGPGLSAEPLLRGTMSWGETDYRPRDEEPAQFNPDRDLAPPITVAAAVGPRKPPPGLPPGMEEAADGPRLVVFGSSLSFVNDALAVQPANLYLLQNAVHWAARKERLGVPGRTIETMPAQVTEGQLLAGRYAFIIGVPALIVALGIAVWFVRRR